MVLSAEDFVEAMGWSHASKKEHVQRQLFPDLNEEENAIMQLLQQSGDGMHINSLVVTMNWPINKISALLFELEMKGMVRALAGGLYQAMQ